jgi:hypothetical protein
MDRYRTRGGAPERPLELPLVTCYVGVGGYGTVELRAVCSNERSGPSVYLRIPSNLTDPQEAECVLQTADTIVVRGTAGEIARIPVAEIVARGAYAGCRIVGLTSDPDDPATAGRSAVATFEDYLAGISARDLAAKERQEREIH